MDTCLNKQQETLPSPPPHEHETTARGVHDGPTSTSSSFTNDGGGGSVVNMQEDVVVNTENQPHAAAAANTAAYLNSNTLFDALPIIDNNDDDDDDGSTKFNIDDKQTNTTSKNINMNNVNVNVNNVQNVQNVNVNNVNMKTQTKLVDYGVMSDSEDSNSDSDESLSDSETTSDNEEMHSHTTKPNEPERGEREREHREHEHEQSAVRNNTEFRETVSSSDSTSEYESDSSTSFRMKGSDASWEHNNEPPVACLDYSDDEEERQARRMLRNRKQSITEANKTNSLERNKKFEKQMNDKNLLMNERYKNQQNFTARNKKKPDIRPPMMNAAVGPPPPHPWMLHNPAAPMPRPQFWSAPPYQFAYPPYAPLAMFPQLDVTGVPGPRQHFVPPIMAPAPPPNAVFGPPFNPNIPPPIMRPQPVTYFPKPRHPPWVPPPMNIGVNVLQPPRGNFGNGSSYTQ